MKYFYWFWPGELDDDTVDRIKSVGEKGKPDKARVLNSEDEEPPSLEVEKTIRISDINWVEDKEVKDIIWNYVSSANEKAFGFNINSNHFDVQYTKYSGDKKSFYTWHTDNNFIDEKFEDRKLSIIIQLTDPEEYEGGEFEFEINDELVLVDGFSKKGSILVFPSFNKHRVKPVTKGERRSLVSWINGPHFL